ncbi:MAG: helix-hairpin-helix domain-containing protein, partial [Methanobrevibacter sp.]|nr:helix-hairpin-helix domain-containing protein [Methanobrevibacter sp.]
VKETDFENKSPCSTDRTAKLYNADSLLNDYHFKLNELVFDENNQLSLTQDPKISAAENMDIFPVEINSAPFIELIRVPGIGIKSARKIISIRKKMPFKNINELKKLGVVTDRAEKYIKIDGAYQSLLENF